MLSLLLLSSLCVSLYFFSQYVASSTPVFLFIHLAWASDETICALGWLGGPGLCSLGVRLTIHSELLGERVVELLHGDSAIAVVVELAHQHVLLVVGHVDVQSSMKDSIKTTSLKKRNGRNAQPNLNYRTYLRRPAVNSSKSMTPSLFLSSL